MVRLGLGREGRGRPPNRRHPEPSRTVLARFDTVSDHPSDRSAHAATPESWRPYMREGELIRQCLNTGLNSLSKATGGQAGRYSLAFFNLHAGLERTLKLIYIIDFGMNNEGRLPTNDDLQNRLRHNLVVLFEEAQAVRARLAAQGENFDWAVADEEVTKRIIGVLSEFGRSSRYYNLDFLVGKSKLDRDPIAAWWTDVATYLLKDYPARHAAKDEHLADFADALLGDNSVIRRDSELGNPIIGIRDDVLHERQSHWVARQSTFHTATIVRHLAEIVFALFYESRKTNVLSLPHLTEFFGPYFNDDRDLKGKRTFL